MPTLISTCKKNNNHSLYRFGMALAVLVLVTSAAATAQNSDSTTAAPSLYSSSQGNSYAGGSTQNGPFARPSTGSHEDYDFQKYTFAVGGGFNVPAGDTYKYQTTGWNLEIAGGRNLNRYFGAQVQYNYDHFGIPAAQLNLVGEPNGDVHLWSFGLDPYFNIPTHSKMGAYVIGGVGFYRKVTEFTQPYTSCYYYCYTSPVVVEHFSNNAFGANAGLGLTWHVSRWNNVKFFSEARYVWVNNQQSTNSVSDGYTPANDRTGYFPVTLGLRF